MRFSLGQVKLNWEKSEPSVQSSARQTELLRAVAVLDGRIVMDSS